MTAVEILVKCLKHTNIYEKSDYSLMYFFNENAVVVNFEMKFFEDI